ncbi:hypothetical protein TREMEDRAFT_66694 [Tremella mesenterica DSM 1558]|uniref:uncharacterized protein n=1 Tax=Tremella mesenterica (strain ATCC 24925 / CBS 8224 / DSM 1558 / NBRC 9311 / NRRL Y-6157 / RJB 2259-6 / UBC 559-6) TaxID=578456 RepID=UPI0003F4A4C0|nr:uncharacterized protein TREMEDRAFT_66694 [Tremella mesenterica DSM 1558]EIW72067.1 hypothetical protein TREMEDRAFT_66694 [Tremella mesenterica DSM 1558]
MSAPSSSYQTFASAFQSYQDHHSQAGPSSSHLDAPLQRHVILDEENGLVVQLMAAVEEQVRSKSTAELYDAPSDDQLSVEEREALLLEHRTWQLLRTVYENRLNRDDPDFSPISAETLLQKCPYISPEELAQTVVEEDPELSLWAVLIEHLQTRPLLTEPPPLEARHGYLPSTIRRAQASKNALRGGHQTSLDPDFILRDPHGQGLAGEDQTYQTPLLATLWDLVRHGELDQAVKVCEQAGEPWRGATLMGGRRWNMSGMSESNQPSLPAGNRTRALWKKSCRAIAKNPTLSAAERCLYAALISDLSTLIPACETWEDHLWAHVQHRIENRLEARCRDLGGFWEEEARLLGSDEEDSSQVARGGLDEVFASISSVQSESVAMAVNNPYYLAQKMIILDQTDQLLNRIADLIPQLAEGVSPELVGPYIRFFAHLVLLLRTLGQKVPDVAANIILEAYLQILERDGNSQLVAMYAACLREGSGEESYARFLRSMDPNTTKEERMRALSRAKQHDLDVAIIARETVRMIIEEAFATIPPLTVELPDITSIVSGLSERDVYLIRSIEWLTMVPETFTDALVKSNDLARYFLALGQANAAQALLKTLPSDLTDEQMSGADDDENYHQIEHEQFRQLFVVFACHELVGEVLSRAPKNTATKIEQHSWRKSLGSAIDKVHGTTIDLLLSDWLKLPIERSSPRFKELSRIRQIFIPSLILQLHTLLYTHRTLFPQMLQQALALSKIVADEENGIYEEFFSPGGERLVVYLDKIREAALAMLEIGKKPFTEE